MMKKIFLYVICSIIALSISACGSKASSINKASVKVPVYPKSISFDDIKNQISNREKNKLDENFVKAMNDFAYTSASKLLSDNTKNITYSPTSLYMALSIAGIGARNSTQNEIFSVLGVHEKDAAYLSEQNSKLFKLLHTDNEIGKLKIANSVWIQKSMVFKKAFIDNAADNFYASLFNVDFSDKKSSELMCNWISQNTNGILSPQISINKEQIMSILNTIYYKDEWVDRFDKDKTKTDTFYISDGSKVQCDFMNNTFVTHGFTRGKGFITSSLILKNDGSMIFVLPDNGVKAESLLSTPEKAAALFQEENSINGKVIFQIPKFSFGSDLKLNDMLEGLCIKAAFKNNADFSGITDGTAFISSVKQQTHIAIDEKGIEAAAFTKLDYCGSAPAKDEVAEMILNRPFIFAIKANDSILFIGVVNNPNEK